MQPEASESTAARAGLRAETSERIMAPPRLGRVHSPCARRAVSIANDIIIGSVIRQTVSADTASRESRYADQVSITLPLNRRAPAHHDHRGGVSGPTGTSCMEASRA